MSYEWAKPGVRCVCGIGLDRDLENGYNVLRFKPLIENKLPESLTVLLQKPNRVIIPDGEYWDHKRQPEKTR